MSPISCARLRDARALAALGIAVPAALLGGPQAAARPAPAASIAEAGDEQPACGDPDAREFPVEARIQDAPKTYAAGGGYGTWFLDLTNTTGRPCGALHPVLVLTDEERRLTADQIQVKFSGPGRTGTEHRVTWETTDRHEQIGVFDGGGPGPGRSDGSRDSGDSFPGFTVPAGGTVSVRIRMAFTSDTTPGRVTAHAAVVQRHHQNKAKGGGREDGDWVGESGAYPFVIGDASTGEVPRPEDTGADTGGRTDVPAEPRPRTDVSSGAPTPARTGTGPGKEPAPDPSSPARSHEPDGPEPPREDGGGKERLPHHGTGHPLPELARTGPELLPWAGAAAGMLVLGGGALLAKGRRMRRTAAVRSGRRPGPPAGNG